MILHSWWHTLPHQLFNRAEANKYLPIGSWSWQIWLLWVIELSIVLSIIVGLYWIVTTQ